MNLFGYTQEEIYFIQRFRHSLIRKNISLDSFMKSDAVKELILDEKKLLVEQLQAQIKEEEMEQRMLRGKCLRCNGNGMVERTKVSRTCTDCKGTGIIEGPL